MGIEIDREDFVPADYESFRERLIESLVCLRRLLRRPGFGEGPETLGAELEMALVDQRGAALPFNREVLAETVDPRFTVELDRFNLECNLPYFALGERPFERLGRELLGALSEIRAAAAKHGGRVVPIGILPTLTLDDLQPSALTDSKRYRALSQSLRRLRQRPFELVINGRESLRMKSEAVAFEGAATSLQLHLRVPPREFAETFNAIAMATGPALALAGNSPILLGKRLWDETRIALFKQSVDDRTVEEKQRREPPRVCFGEGWVEHGALELFEDGIRHEILLPLLSDERPLDCLHRGGTPRLEELRLHQGTVWSWNRPIFDPAEGGHLRIEVRSLPAGPSVVDMMANAAFLIGLGFGLKPWIREWVQWFPFAAAERNFYRAAQHGVHVELVWPDESAVQRLVPATELVEELLPIARSGLAGLGVEEDESEPLLELIAARAEVRKTGAVWQRGAFEAFLGRGQSHEQALASMLELYIANAEANRPVHLWPLPS